MSSLVIILDALRKCTVKVTPSTTLQAVLVEACTKLKLSASDYALSVNNQELDLSLPFRLSNLTQNQKVQLQKRKTAANASVIIALQLENGDRLQQSFLSNVTFSDLLRFWEAKLSLNTSQNWVIQFMNQEFPFSAFQTTTLASIGLTSGSGLLRLLQKNTTSSPSPVHKEEPKPTVSEPKEEEEEEEENSKENSMQVEEEETVVEIPVHRNVQVVMPTEVTENQVMDDSFYNVTMDDLAYLVALEKRSREAKDMLLTKKLREQFKNTKRYKQSDIRIKFPDRVQIQGTFGGNATTEELVAWIRDQLEITDTFYLYTAPPLKRLENGMTLDEQKLVPAAIVHLAWENKDLNEKPTIDLLKKQTIETAKENEKQEKPTPVEEEIRVTSGKEEEVDKKPAAKSSAAGPVPKWLKMGNKR